MAEFGKTGNLQDTRGIHTESAEVKLLTTTFQTMEIDLEKAHKEHIEKVKLDQEITLAGQIQQRFLPKSGFKSGDTSITGILVPAAKVGGDMYDIIPIGKDQVLFYLADVTGHGVSAGVVSSMISSGIDIISSTKKSIGPNDLEALAIALHQVLFKKTLTLFPPFTVILALAV